MASQRVDPSAVKFIVRSMAVLGGMAAIVAVLLLQLLAALGLGTDFFSIYLFFGIVPAMTEEPFKQLGLALITYRRPSWISSRRDGMIAGALAGLSFGIFEALFYFMSGFGATRILTVLMHVGASSVGGLGIYYGCKREYGRMLLWIGAAIGIHLAWNSAVLAIAWLL